MHGGSGLWSGAEIFDSGEIGIAICFAVEEHQEVVANALVGCFGSGRRIFFAGRNLFEHVRKNVRKNPHDVLPCRSGGVAENQLFDVFGVGRCVGHREQATVGVADQIELLETEFGANGLHVGDLSLHPVRSIRFDLFGFASAALIVEDDLPVA